LRPLSAGSINKTIDHLQWILSMAIEYKLIGENPAVGRRRRLKEPRRPPVYLDTASQIEALLDAARELDCAAASQCRERHATIATLVLAGPRAGELCDLQWRDVDLANGRIFIGRSKTQAGLREIPMLPVLRDSLAAYKARAYRSGSEDLVFPSGTGGSRNKDNLRSRVLLPVFERADQLLEAQGHVPLPRGLTAHKLRHTFASVLIACGEDPHSVMRQLGHTDPAFTLRVYTHGMARSPEERTRLAALVQGEWTSSVCEPPVPPRQLHTKDYEIPIISALQRLGGSAPRREITKSVQAKLGSRMTPLDRERLPSGMPRWITRLSKARANLIRDGVLRAGTPRGVWELESDGRKSNGKKSELACSSTV
jgi:integrase